MPKTEITPALQARIRETYARNGNKKATAAILGLGETTVGKYLRAASDGASATQGVSEERLAALVAAALDARLGAGAPLAETAKGRAEDGFRPTPLTVRLHKQYRKVLFISDLHYPFHDAAAVAAVLAFARDYRPDLVVLAGDQLDCYELGDWPKDLERTTTLQDEADSLRPFVKEVDALGCDVNWIDGNHEWRIARTIANKAPGLHKLRGLTIPELCQLPRRWSYHPNQTHLRLGGVVMHHGNLKQGGGGGGESGPAPSMRKKMRVTNIFGHWHKMGTHYTTDYDGNLQVGIANGHLSDIPQQTYTRVPDWVKCVTTIEFHWGPDRFSVHQHPVEGGGIVYGGRLYEA